MKLRDYQSASYSAILSSWLAVKNILLVAPTGSGKTVVMGEVIKNHKGAACAIAHRNELVSQISMALARSGIKHKIIGNTSMIREIVKLHVSELGVNFVNPSSSVAVASVGTLLARKDSLKNWCQSVTLWVTDEAHHVLEGNQWGKACDLFPNAKGLGVTATPLRADGAGLGTHSDGKFDNMIESSTMRELIRRGYLTEYRIFAPPSDLDMVGVKTTAIGDFSTKETKKRIEKSHILGDVVKHYLRIAPNKLGITFAVDVETATDLCDRYNAAGVPADVVTAKTSITDRASILRKFAQRQILQIVNVDLFGEGFDLPALEVVSFARPTASYGLYIQQFGRVLRTIEGKDHGIIIDHVGNVDRHGLPDEIHSWTLSRREKSKKSAHDPDLIPLKTCTACTGKYEAFLKNCPYCGHVNTPQQRSTPDQVDGDLSELTPEVLAIMRGDAKKIDRDPKIPQCFSGQIQVGISNRHFKKQKAIEDLRMAIRWFGGYQSSLGFDISQSYKFFYWRFNIDVLTAQTLKQKDAEKLTDLIKNYLFKKGVTI